MTKICVLLYLVSMCLPGFAFAQPKPSDQLMDVGGSFINNPQIKKNSYAAMLFLDGTDQTAQKVCRQYKIQYEDSLHDPVRPYKKMVYFPKKKSYTNAEINCDRWSFVSDPLIYNNYSMDLNLEDKGDGPLLVIISKDMNGKSHNMGYVKFSDADDAAISRKFRRFNTYYHCDQGQWTEDKMVDDDSWLAVVMRTVKGGC